MLVPLSWLRDFTPYEGSAQTLGDKLTMLGLELEEIINPFADIAGIKVGYVASCLPHPDSDHLHCCKVDIGEGDLLDIVCGAANVADGQKVAVAPVGCKLPDGTVIKKAKLRGQPSQGMICSERELGLSEDHSGIMVLPESADVGHSLIDALGLDTEVLDLSITPNRSDCLSILGIARETAMAFKLPFHIPELPFIPNKEGNDIAIPVEIKNPDLCWLYSGRVITGVKIATSPMKMRYRLMAAGIRPISNIVDVTNYILVECGQPLHSFDMDKLSGGKIIVQTAKEGEKFVTLDGKERVLSSTDLCICDAEKAVGLAGVMGGQNTEITSSTTNVFLESAVFKPGVIRKTARRLGLNSEASYRFERGINQQATIMALDRACALMASIGGGLPQRSLSCVEPRPFVACEIEYRPTWADALLGVKLDRNFQKETLTNLGCAVENFSGEEWRVIQPSWRPDLTREADLVEEVGRVYGLDAIPPELPPITKSLDDDFAGDSAYSFISRIKEWGAGLGLNEAVNYSFVGDADLDHLKLETAGRVSISNPLSEDQNVLRTALAPGLLQDLANNLAFDVQSVKLFEVANVFVKNPESETSVAETQTLGILLYGLRHDNGWPHMEEDFAYNDIKGVAEHLLQYLHLGEGVYTEKGAHPFLDPCIEVTVKSQSCGFIGRIKPALAQKYNAQKCVWLAEINLAILRELHDHEKIEFVALPKFPAVKRDITVIAARKTRVEDILEKIIALRLPFFEGAILIDSYEPENAQDRNLTFRLTFRHSSRTLKDAEVDKEREKVADFLRSELDVRI